MPRTIVTPACGHWHSPETRRSHAQLCVSGKQNKKTPPQGTKSKHKNIEPVNSRIDGLIFLFSFLFLHLRLASRSASLDKIALFVIPFFHHLCIFCVCEKSQDAVFVDTPLPKKPFDAPSNRRPHPAPRGPAFRTNATSRRRNRKPCVTHTTSRTSSSSLA